MWGNALPITLGGIAVYLLPQRALYIPAHQLLVIADWHLGKIQHFRKNGIFIPQNTLADELQQLTALTAVYPTRHVLFLGDLFHSSWNPEWDMLLTYLTERTSLTFSLIIGNHDIIDFDRNGSGRLALYDRWELDNQLIFTHQPMASVPDAFINVTGHVHPGYTIRARGKQRYRLPCFYRERQTFILPAFGKYTGLHTVSPAEDAAIYLIVGDEVVHHRPRLR